MASHGHFYWPAIYPALFPSQLPLQNPTLKSFGLAHLDCNWSGFTTGYESRAILTIAFNFVLWYISYQLVTSDKGPCWPSPTQCRTN